MSEHSLIDLCEQLKIDSKFKIYLIYSPAMLDELKLKHSYDPIRTYYVLIETIGNNADVSNNSKVWMVVGRTISSCEENECEEYLSLIRKIVRRMMSKVICVNQISEVEYRNRYAANGNKLLARLIARDHSTRSRSFVSRGVEYTASIRGDKPQAFEGDEIVIDLDKLISIPESWTVDVHPSLKAFTVKDDMTDQLAEHLFALTRQPIDVISFTTWDDEVYNGLLTGTDIPEVQMLIAKATQNHSFPKTINVPHIRWSTPDGIENVGLLFNIGHEAEGRQCLTWMILASQYHRGGCITMY